MKPKTITVDRLNEAQMEQVRDYLDSMPNKSHRGSKDEFYGNYINVSANVSASIDGRTAKASIHGYKDVAFEIKDIGVQCEYTAKRKAERNQVATGLVTLLAGFFTQE